MGKKKKNKKKEKQLQEALDVVAPNGIDELLIQANYVSKAFDCVFQASDPLTISPLESSVTVNIPDMALIYIDFDDGQPFCEISLYDGSPAILVAELMCIIKDIFGHNVKVGEDTYIEDPVNDTLIWGRKRIDTHNENVWGRRVKHTVYFADDSGGHA